MPNLRPRRWSLTHAASWVFTLLALGGLAGLVVVFIFQSLLIWRHSGLRFVSGHDWYYRQETFGAASMIYGTLVVAAVALGLAGPIGIGAAIFTAEYLPRRLRLAVKLTIELLAGVPSVVYGLLGILLLRNWVYDLLEPFDPLSGDTLLTAGLGLILLCMVTGLTLLGARLRRSTHAT